MRVGTQAAAAWRGLAAAGMACLLLCAGGCFTRRIVIETSPVAADVIINQRNMGPSPVAIQTADFGDLDLRIEAPGFQPIRRRLENPRPWYGYDPLFFLIEVAPYPFRSEAVVRIELSPQDPIDPKVLDQHAVEADRQAATEPQAP